MPVAPSRVSVVVPTHDRRHEVATAVTALKDDPAIQEIIVVVDGSTDGTVAELRALASTIPHLRTFWQEQAGAGAARQNGLERAGGDVVLFLDDDVLPGPLLASGHLAAHQEMPGCVIVGAIPPLRPPRRSVHSVVDDLYAADYEDCCQDYLRDPSSVLSHLWSGNLSINRRQALSLGIGDLDFDQLFFEDRDFGLRLRAGRYSSPIPPRPLRGPPPRRHASRIPSGTASGKAEVWSCYTSGTRNRCRTVGALHHRAVSLPVQVVGTGGAIKSAVDGRRSRASRAPPDLRDRPAAHVGPAAPARRAAATGRPIDRGRRGHEGGFCGARSMKVLITGGAGYIGSTIASACAAHDIAVVLIDDLSAGPRAFTSERTFYEGDFADGGLIDRIFDEHPDLTGVVHCGAKISVADSMLDPLDYYDTNVSKTVKLIRHLVRHKCTQILFSSSASVYSVQPGGADEDAPTDPQSPYARTKLMCEQVLADACGAFSLGAVALRYFNPIGADPALRSGPHDPNPSHVVGKLMDAKRNGRPFFVNGTDWPTRDGTALRDFIHVWDLAEAHVRALTSFDRLIPTGTGFEIVNIGTGTGTTIRELVDAFQGVVGPVEIQEAGRRAGDVAGCFAITGKATRLLDWWPAKTLSEGLADALAWQNRQSGLSLSSHSL